MDGTALFKCSYGLYVLGAEKEGGFGGCIADALMQVTVEPPTLALGCNRGNFTNGLILKNKEFTVSVLSETTDPFVVANFGFQSGRDTDKWANVPHDLKEGLPVLRGACAFLRCRLTSVTELSTHSLFLCDILDAWQGEGQPLTYGAYQRDMKAATLAAFRAFQKDGAPAVGASSVSVPASAPASAAPASAQAEEKKWVCGICGYVYDGDVPFEELPSDWKCPLCKQPKSVFHLQ